MRRALPLAIAGACAFVVGVVLAQPAATPAPTPPAAVVRLAPARVDYDHDGSVSILDAAAYLVDWRAYFLQPAQCAYYAIYPTALAQPTPGCDYIFEVPASTLPTPRPH